MPMNNEEARGYLEAWGIEIVIQKKREKFLEETSIKLASC